MTASIHRTQIAELIGSLQIHSLERFGWCGRTIALRYDATSTDLTLAERRSLLVKVLSEHLYRYFYRVGMAVPVPLGPTSEGAVAEDDHYEVSLHEANSGRGCWEPGWILVGNVGEDGATVRRGKDGIQLVAAPDQWRLGNDSSQSAETIGARYGIDVEVLQPKGLFRRSPGYYYAIGDACLPQSPPLRRVYWHVTPLGGPPLMRHVTERLNAMGQPFHLKVASRPDNFDRADTAVLYIPRQDYERLEPQLLDIHDELRSSIADSVPALTLRLAPGLSIADDPGRGESFGMHRCRSLAEAVISHWEHGRTGRSIEQSVAEIEALLESGGLTIAQIHLQPESAAQPLPSLHIGRMRAAAS